MTPLLPQTPKKPLRSILKKQRQPSLPTEDVKSTSSLEAQTTKERPGTLKELLCKLEKQLALQKEISLLLAEQMLRATPGNESLADAESYQCMMDDLQRSENCIREMQRKILVSCST